MAIPRISYKPPTAEEEASTWSGATPAGPAQVYLPPAPAPRPAPRPVTRTTSTPTRTVSSGGSGGSGGTGGSGGGGSSEPKKSADKAQVNALETLLNSGLKQALDQRLANIQQAQDTSDAVLLGGYNSRHKRLSELDDDNDKAEGAASWQNV